MSESDKQNNVIGILAIFFVPLILLAYFILGNLWITGGLTLFLCILLVVVLIRGKRQTKE